MSAFTKIQWCDSTVNPVMGCDGCELWNDTNRTCYAGTLHERFGGVSPGYAPTFEQVTQFPGRMAVAAGWPDLAGTQRLGTAKKPAKPWLDGHPRLIFVSDMGDSLSAGVPFDYLYAEVYQNAVSRLGRRHVWLWLTKRPERLHLFALWLKNTHGHAWPKNVWPGTSVTTQKSTGRVFSLAKIGDETTTRFLSVEPQWEAVRLAPWLKKGVGWVIQGGESGADPKPFDLAWADDLRGQCEDAGVPYFLKQLGGHAVENGVRLALEDGHGGEWDEWPERLRVRQLPKWEAV